MSDYLEYLERNGKLDDYYAMIDKEAQDERERQERINFLFPMVRSALSGNGIFPVNYMLRRYRKNDFFSHYTQDEWYYLYKRITLWLLNYYDEIDFKESAQMWVNWKVLTYVKDLCRKWNGRNDTKIKCNVDQRANENEIVAYTDLIETFYDEKQLNQEQLVIIKDIIDKIDKVIKGDACVYLDVYAGVKTKREACAELKISYPTFMKRYNEFIELLKRLK